MLNGVVYLVGLVMGGGWRGLLPRRSDLLDAFRMLRYYLGIPFAKLNAVQMAASQFQYKVQRAPARSVLLCSARRLPFGSDGWAIHKPMQFHLLAAIFGGFDAARDLAFLAHVGLHPFRRTPCDSGFHRRVGYVPRHARGLVGESKSVGGHG